MFLVWIFQSKLVIKNGEKIQRNLVISELPDEFAYSKYLGELRWISDTEVALYNKKSDEMVSVEIQK